MINGLNYIHSKRIVHRDIKPGNILFKKYKNKVTFAIADFGLATSLDKSNQCFLRCGTYGYVAP